MDLAVNNHLQLRTERVPGQTTDLWVSTDDPEKVREEIRPALPANTRIDTSADLVGRQVLGAASIALWGAAVCCLLIAIVAVSSASQSRVRWGRNDIASLRAIGLGARDQSAVLLREFGVVLGAATVLGFVAGAVVSVLTVPELARAAVDRSYLESETGLGVDWLGLGMLLLVLAMGVALVLAGLTRRVRVIASTSLPSEGHE
jgi:predicted lysophospholipase L1 biosynthesis ABC-type transport system permease subunit